MSYPYTEAADLYSDWIVDPFNPIDPNKTVTVRCPACFEEIRINALNDDEVIALDRDTVFHKECVEKELTGTPADCINYLDGKDGLLDFFNYYFKEEEKPINALPYKLKRALIMYGLEDKDSVNAIAQYIRDDSDELQNFLRWCIDEKKA